MKNTVSIDIAAPPARVFALLNDSESLKQWIPNLIEDEVTESKEGGVGSRFRQVYLENGRRMEMAGQVTAYEQDRHLACDIRGKAFDLIVEYRISPEGDGTRLTQDTEIMFKSVPMKIIGTLMKPLMTKAARKQQDASFAKLKSLAES